MKQSTLIKRYAGSAAALLLTIACGAANAQVEQQSSEYNTTQAGDGDTGTSPSSNQKDRFQKMLEMKRQSNGQGNSGGNGPESGTQQAPQ
jgi:hypothetical protein